MPEDGASGPGRSAIGEDLPSLVSEVGQFVSDMETLCADG